MRWTFWCSNPTKAARRYTQRFAAMMVFYILTVLRVTQMVRAHSPVGWKLYLLSALPTIPIVAMMVVIGLYLKEERDEFKRLQIVRSMLLGIAATFVVSTFFDFLASYGGRQQLPPFTLFTVFWIAMALSQAVQAVQNRVKSDDEPAA